MSLLFLGLIQPPQVLSNYSWMMLSVFPMSVCKDLPSFSVCKTFVFPGLKYHRKEKQQAAAKKVLVTNSERGGGIWILSASQILLEREHLTQDSKCFGYGEALVKLDKQTNKNVIRVLPFLVTDAVYSIFYHPQCFSDPQGQMVLIGTSSYF